VAYDRLKSSIQSDSEENVNILKCNIFDNCEEKSSYEQVANSEWLLS